MGDEVGEVANDQIIYGLTGHCKHCGFCFE